MKSLIGLTVAFLLGAGCRFFDLPVPSPPRMLGAFLVVAVTAGYMAADRFAAKTAPARTAVVRPSHASLAAPAPQFSGEADQVPSAR
jgi:XapX domain-containing protein